MSSMPSKYICPNILQISQPIHIYQIFFKSRIFKTDTEEIWQNINAHNSGSESTSILCPP